MMIKKKDLFKLTSSYSFTVGNNKEEYHRRVGKVMQVSF